MKRKFIITVIIILMAVATMVACGHTHNYVDGACTECGSKQPTEGLKYIKIYGKEEYSVNGIGTATATDIVIAEEYDGMPVTSIGMRAFKNCEGLISITIPDSITSIDSEAFYGCGSLRSVTIPDSIKSIASGAFGGCSSLTSVTIGSGVTSIEKYVFGGCISLTSLTIPDNITHIGEGAFDSCSGLTNIVIPNSVKSIGSEAFSECSSLTNVIIPDSVTSIGQFAFEGCSSLRSVTIPSSVTKIESRAFEHCSSLTRIEVNENNQQYKSIDGNLYSKDGKTLVQYAIGKESSSFEIPDSVTHIGEVAFAYCSSLTNILIPNSLTSIEYGAFYGCGNITNITIPNSVTHIGDYVFEGCSLTSVYYKGTEEQWNEMGIDDDNDKLESATKYYYSETEPTTDGNYWHYDEDGNIVVWEKE